MDLFPNVKYWNLAVDDPLQMLLTNGRTLATTDLSDSLWTRLIDVPDALQRRTYEGSGRITIGVEDGFADWNEGTYRLDIDEGVASCERVTAEADVSMDVNTLGALYMGGQDATGLARVGRIEGSPESVRKLDGLFRGAVAPWCAEIF